MITQSCVDTKFFTNRKFKEDPEGTFTRQDLRTFTNITNGLKEGIINTIQFKVIGVHPELGTEIEIRINGRMDNKDSPNAFGSGYFLDQKDFESTFKNL